jgi:voltage-gated potassium channel
LSGRSAVRIVAVYNDLVRPCAAALRFDLQGIEVSQTERRSHALPISAVDRWLARPMFAASFAFSAGLAVVLHMNDTVFWEIHGRTVRWSMLGLYALFPLEALVHWRYSRAGLKQHALFCLLPPARMGARDHASQSAIWLPHWGWQPVGRHIAHRLTRVLSGPMIGIALLVIPVIVFTLFFEELLLAHPRLNTLVEATSGLIWLCFTAEFILMLAVVPNRWRYFWQHWINAAVIVLPAIAFFRVLNLGRLLSLKQLVRTSRVFGLRGLLFRTWRAIVTLDLIDMVLRRNPAVRLERTRVLLAEKQEEVELLRSEIARLEAMAAKQASEATSTHVPSGSPRDLLPAPSAKGVTGELPPKR